MQKKCDGDLVSHINRIVNAETVKPSPKEDFFLAAPYM